MMRNITSVVRIEKWCLLLTWTLQICVSYRWCG